MDRLTLIFSNVRENINISEVNPRFGGGYPHAYEAGANHMKYIVNNLQGKVNEPQIGEYESGVDHDEIQ